MRVIVPSSEAVGTSTAYYLAEEGHEVVVLDLKWLFMRHRSPVHLAEAAGLDSACPAMPAMWPM